MSEYYTVYTDVGQLKVNKKVMCQMSMKLPAMLDQNHPKTYNKLVEKRIKPKMLSKLHLQPKCQGHSRNRKTMTLRTKNMPPKTIRAWGP